MLAYRLYCITYQSLRDDVRSSELVTHDAIPHVYGKAILVVTFEASMRIIMNQYMRVYGIFHSIAVNKCLVGKQNVTNYLGVSINKMVGFQPATMPAGSRCRMRWIWYRHNSSVCEVHQVLN
jgi:hypothetical protein